MLVVGASRPVKVFLTVAVELAFFFGENGVEFVLKLR